MTRTPDMVQELMCGQRQAPMLQLASRRGGDRRVVECLPEIIDGGLYRDARSRERFRIFAKQHHLLLSVSVAILDRRIRIIAGRAGGMPSGGRNHVWSPDDQIAVRVGR